MNSIKNDPITTEIIQSSLQAACDEMFVAMRKTAMSSIIYEVLDFGTAVTDSNGNKAVEVTRKVTVVDSTKPVITLLGDAEVTVF